MRKTSALVSLTAMIPTDVRDRLDAQVRLSSAEDACVSRSDIVRQVLLKGLSAIEKSGSRK